MKLWKPLLLVLPAGLFIGVIGGRMVDSGNPRQAEEAARAEAAAVDRLALETTVEEWPAPAGADGSLPAAPDTRPELDWTAEFWPEDDGGAYDYDGDYFGQGRPALARPDDADARDTDARDTDARDADARYVGDVGTSRSFARDSEAASAARAAARAVRDAASMANEAPSPPSEPRTADGELPAIW